LPLCIPLVCRFAKPCGCTVIILGNAFAVLVGAPNVELRFRVALLGAVDQFEYRKGRRRLGQKWGRCQQPNTYTDATTENGCFHCP